MKREDIDGLEFTVGEVKERGKGNSIYDKVLSEDEPYEVELVSIVSERAPFGEVLKWIFELTDPEFSYEFDDKETGEEKTGRRRVSGATSLLCNPKTKMYKWYTKLIGRELNPGERIKLKELLGINCKVFVKNTEGRKANEDGEYPIYSNVDRIIPNKSRDKSKTKSKSQTKKIVKRSKKQKKEVFPQSAVDGNGTEGEDPVMFEDIF